MPVRNSHRSNTCLQCLFSHADQYQQLHNISPSASFLHLVVWTQALLAALLAH
jgi:hypothetical protein